MPRDRRLTAHDPLLAFAMCTACALSLASFGSFPALMPRLFVAWQMSTREAAYINAAFYAGYMLVSPVLTTLTDRVDARRLVLSSCSLGVISALAFAAVGHDFWPAVATRALSGVATAGSFMPGLRALTDRVHVSKQARYVGYYMACFALGTSLSYAACEWVADAHGARVALAGMALGPLVARLLLQVFLEPLTLPPRPVAALLPDPRPILRNPAALGIVCCYGLHTWELFTLRSWGVSFLTFTQRQQGFAAPFWWAPATVLAAANVLTAPASVFGGEVAQKLGRARWIGMVMTASALALGLLGTVAHWPAVAACVAVLVCGMLLGADSASLTSGLVAVTPESQRGLGMAVHTTVGFAGAFVGPLAFGLLLDAAGGQEQASAWVTSFAATGTVTLLLGVLVRWRLFR